LRRDGREEAARDDGINWERYWADRKFTSLGEGENDGDVRW